ncbi:hypothetical protein AAY473_028415, partial [Plecturocebus cupreus]
MCHHTQLIFVFLVDTRFYHVGQGGLKLLTSSDLPALAAQSAGITGVGHHTWPKWQPQLKDRGLQKGQGDSSDGTVPKPEPRQGSSEHLVTCKNKRHP